MRNGLKKWQCVRTTLVVVIAISQLTHHICNRLDWCTEMCYATKKFLIWIVNDFKFRLIYVIYIFSLCIRRTYVILIYIFIQ
jgi:hypothetical protein